MADQEDLLSAVHALQSAANRHAIDEVMAMFSDDAEYELTGLTRLVGKDQIRTIFEYDAGVNGEIEFINCAVHGDTVTCHVVERNDRLRVAGVERLVWPSCVISFRGLRIRSFQAMPDPEARSTFDRFWDAVRPWIGRHYPADSACLFTPDGRFIRNRENGQRAVELAKEYRARAAT